MWSRLSYLSVRLHILLAMLCYSSALRFLLLPTIPRRFSASGAVWELLSSAWAKYVHNSGLSVAPTSGGNHRNTVQGQEYAACDSYQKLFGLPHQKLLLASVTLFYVNTLENTDIPSTFLSFIETHLLK